MKVDLYICNETFSHNISDSNIDVKRKLSDFQKMLDEIRKYKDENTIYLIVESFISTVIFDDGKTIGEIISDHQNSELTYGNEVLMLLYSIFKHCKRSDISLEEMKEYLNLEDENNCNAIIVLNPLDGYEKHLQVLSNVGSWFQFRRNYLAKYPGDEHFFISESKKFFLNLCINEGTKTTLKEVLKSHSRQIVAYLSVLNDSLIADYMLFGNANFVSFLPHFAMKYKMDAASFEGRKDEKFRFSFPDGTNAYCEPHLKMYKDDSGNTNQHCRIYFKSPEIDDSIVYVGSICKHL